MRCELSGSANIMGAARRVQRPEEDISTNIFHPYRGSARGKRNLHSKPNQSPSYFNGTKINPTSFHLSPSSSGRPTGAWALKLRAQKLGNLWVFSNLPSHSKSLETTNLPPWLPTQSARDWKFVLLGLESQNLQKLYLLHSRAVYARLRAWLSLFQAFKGDVDPIVGDAEEDMDWSD